MNGSFREEKYSIGGREFVKRYASDGGVAFFCDGREIGIADWNRLLNESRPMSVVADHANPLVRMKERLRRKEFLALAGGARGAVVADVGCEEGHLAERLAGISAVVYCMDIDSAVLSRAQRRLAGAQGGTEFRFVTCDVRNIPLPDNSVDVCLASEVLEHLPAPEEGLAELVRITRPGGRVAISVPNEPLVLAAKRAARAAGLGRSLGSLDSGLAVGHVQIFTMKKLRALCERSLRIDLLKYSAPFFLNIFAAGTPLKK